MRVERLTLREIRLPLTTPFRSASGTVSERRILLLELHAPDGTRGWSECVAGEDPSYSPETVDTARHMIRTRLGPRVLGRERDGPEEVHPLLQQNIRGHPMAKAAVEMGCWELAARLRGEPLAALLGGSRERVPVGVALGIRETPAALAEEARAAFEEGYRKVKLKIKPGADIDHIAAVREALGPDAAITADANSAYTLEDADHLTRLDQFNLAMLEQPLGPDDLVRHAALQERLRTPICLDESITSPERAEDMITLGSGRIINLKPGRVGGHAASIRIHDLCARSGVPVWCGGMLESGIGRAHNVALASLANFRLPGDLSPSARYWERDIVRPEWTMESDGTVRVPLEEPGMGVEVNRNRVEDLTLWTETLGGG